MVLRASMHLSQNGLRRGAGLIVTDGVRPNRAGCASPIAMKMTSQSAMRQHMQVTQAAEHNCGNIALQILHAGRYATHHFPEAPFSADDC